VATIRIRKPAARYLKKLPAPLRERIKKIIAELAEDPLGYNGIVAMSGDWKGYYRIRIGDLRLIFWYDAINDEIIVAFVGPRGDIYKK